MDTNGMLETVLYNRMDEYFGPGGTADSGRLNFSALCTVVNDITRDQCANTLEAMAANNDQGITTAHLELIRAERRSHSAALRDRADAIRAGM